MKIKLRLNNVFNTIKEYPMVLLAVLLATIFYVCYICDVNFGLNNYYFGYNLVVSLLYLAMAFMITKLITSDKSKDFSVKHKILFYVLDIIAIAAISYFGFFRFGENYGLQIRIFQIGMFLSLFIGMFIVGKSNIQSNYASYVVKIIISIIESIVYCVVIFAGVVAISLTIRELFKIEFRIDTMAAIAGTIVFLMFNSIMILSKFPLHFEESDQEVRWISAFKFLFTRIVEPIFLAYGIVLVVYFGKVIISKSIPNNVITNLVLWYGLLSVIVLMMAKTIDDKFTKVYSKIQPILILISSVMMFYSMYLRINKYGITEERYLVVAGGIFIVLSMIYYLFFNKKTAIVIPITLLVIVLISTVGPVSAYNMSKIDQKGRLDKLLTQEHILVDGKIQKVKNVNPAIIKEIVGKLEYFSQQHKIQELPYMSRGFYADTTNIYNVFGFRGDEFESKYGENRTYSFEKDEWNVEEYDKIYGPFSFDYDISQGKLGDYYQGGFLFEKQSNEIVIEYKNQKIGKVNLEEIDKKLQNMWDKQGPNIDGYTDNDMVISEGVVESHKYKIILKSANYFYSDGQKAFYEFECLYKK